MQGEGRTFPPRAAVRDCVFLWVQGDELYARLWLPLLLCIPVGRLLDSPVKDCSNLSGALCPPSLLGHQAEGSAQQSPGGAARPTA